MLFTLLFLHNYFFLVFFFLFFGGGCRVCSGWGSSLWILKYISISPKIRIQTNPLSEQHLFLQLLQSLLPSRPNILKIQPMLLLPRPLHTIIPLPLPSPPASSTPLMTPQASQSGNSESLSHFHPSQPLQHLPSLVSLSLIYKRCHYLGCLWLFLLPFASSFPLLLSPKSLREFAACLSPSLSLCSFSSCHLLSVPTSLKPSLHPRPRHIYPRTWWVAMPKECMLTQNPFLRSTYICTENVMHASIVLESDILEWVSKQGSRPPGAFILER